MDPTTGEVQTVSGDPEDPVIKSFMEKAKQAVSESKAGGFSLLKPSTWFGANAPVAAPPSVATPVSQATPRGEDVTPALAPARPAASPFKEGARIKSKKDGKFYIVKNGVPVPEE